MRLLVSLWRPVVILNTIINTMKLWSWKQLVNYQERCSTLVRSKDDVIVTNGGRVLCATALGSTVGEAQRGAYQLVQAIHWKNHYYRKDIGHRAIAREKHKAHKPISGTTQWLPLKLWCLLLGNKR